MRSSLAAAAFLLALSGSASLQEGTARPNIVLILVDDLGGSDLGVQGSAYYETPHIDRLAARGMRFPGALSACTVCSPTRAALLTGMSPARLHLTDWIDGHKRPNARLSVPAWTKHLPPETTTLAEALRARGYATASIGKWHLGGSESTPEKHGFDLNIGGGDLGHPPSYFSPYKISSLPDGPAGESLTTRLTDEALKFIEENRAKPFFLYLPHYAVHTPLQVEPERIQKYKGKGNPQGLPAYAAMIETVDESVGRLVARLEELKLSKNTVVVFTSDNGGLALKGVTTNLGARAGKGSAYEGGIRIPLFISWPGRIKAGGVSRAIPISMDLFPTLMELAGAPPVEGDGASLVPVLLEKGELRRDALYWHYPHYHPGGATPHGAIREGDWRLVEFFEDGAVELYNLKEDPAESRDLSKAMAPKAAALRKKLVDWRVSVGAQMPSPNPAYDPGRNGK